MRANFHIYFEDRDLIVVEKPAAWLTVPTPRGETDTLRHHLQSYLRKGRHAPRLEMVQRLDRGVSGILVCGKTPQAGRALGAQFSESKPEREYVALVAGLMRADAGCFDQWLITDRNSLQRLVSPRPGVGESAITHYKVIARKPGVTRVSITLETGRRNQIRVHFAHAGHPVLGDPRYGDGLAFHPRWQHRRMALHAAVLGFVHPITGRPLRFTSPAPREFEAVC